MTPEHQKKLKDGDIIRNTVTGNAFTVVRNLGDIVIATRTIEIHNAREWEQVYVTVKCEPNGTPLPAPAPAPVISLVHIITELQALGWTFNEATNRWTSPNRNFQTTVLRCAWDERNNYPSKSRPRSIPPLSESTSFSERRGALVAAGWKNTYGKIWLAPSGCHFDGSLSAYAAMIQGTKPVDNSGDCNAS